MDTFTVIAEPSRRRILDALADEPQAVNKLVKTIGMSQPVISKHLRILREADLVTVTPDGQRRLYSLNPAPLEELDIWLGQYRKFWSERFDALSRHLDQIQ
jgi:DNA-binding transcriptional ArsR family regulator